MDQKNAILGPESQKMSFFEEVMIIFQKMWFEKKNMTWDVQYVHIATYLPWVRGYYQQHSPQMGKNLSSDPIAMVFWSKNRVLYTARPPKGYLDIYIYIPNINILILYIICIYIYLT